MFGTRTKHGGSARWVGIITEHKPPQNKIQKLESTASLKHNKHRHDNPVVSHAHVLLLKRLSFFCIYRNANGMGQKKKKTGTVNASSMVESEETHADWRTRIPGQSTQIGAINPAAGKEKRRQENVDGELSRVGNMRTEPAASRLKKGKDTHRDRARSEEKESTAQQLSPARSPL